jgi:hypothetical protein
LQCRKIAYNGFQLGEVCEVSELRTIGKIKLLREKNVPAEKIEKICT